MHKTNRTKKTVFSVSIIVIVLASTGAGLWLSESASSINYAFNYDFYYQKEDNNWFTVNWVSNNRTEGTLLSVECYNTGLMDGTFDIVIEFTNATFSTQTHQPYSQLSTSTVKFPLTLKSGEHQAVDVYFKINNDVTDFNVKVLFESSQLFIHSTESNPHNINTMYYTQKEDGTFRQTNMIQ